jgi:hypothetical protein
LMSDILFGARVGSRFVVDENLIHNFLSRND